MYLLNVPLVNLLHINLLLEYISINGSSVQMCICVVYYVYMQMFLAFSSGATLLVIPESAKASPTQLATLLFARNTPTIIQVAIYVPLNHPMRCTLTLLPYNALQTTTTIKSNHTEEVGHTYVRAAYCNYIFLFGISCESQQL